MKQSATILWKYFSYFLALSIATVVATLFISHSVPNAGTAKYISVILASALAGFAVIWKINKSFEKSRGGARILASGRLSHRLDVPLNNELGDLATTLNDMAEQLEERIATIGRERNEQELILSSMAEGVIAVDDRFMILRINDAAARLIGDTAENLTGRSFHEVVRNRDLQQLIDRTIDDKKQHVKEVLFRNTIDHYLQARCTPLKITEDSLLGALLVMNDITHLRRLEGIRRDFVANVSHELKTPLTSIKGFAETLHDGAMNDPEESKKFCNIITKQVDRLQSIIEDLLSLSRIEQEAEGAHLNFSTCSLFDVLTNASQCVQHQASEKNISIHVECEPSYTAALNPEQFEQVAVNLMDNAIKYSDPDTDVCVRVVPHENEWEILFIDHGHGIPPSHIDRIFERFYRVDKARSRKAGGTGLGLAIVKHIVSSHGGRIEVESTVEKGSTFRVFLPIS